jgi:hypothetical protein
MYIILKRDFSFPYYQEIWKCKLSSINARDDIQKKIRKISSMSDIIIRALNFTRKICTFVLEV